jgi:hypothetical protein
VEKKFFKNFPADGPGAVHEKAGEHRPGKSEEAEKLLVGKTGRQVSPFRPTTLFSN